MLKVLEYFIHDLSFRGVWKVKSKDKFMGVYLTPVSNGCIMASLIRYVKMEKVKRNTQMGNVKY